jgi:tRNA dimethylallyltransferase
MVKKRPKIIVIVGPTASGKTGLSLHIAQKIHGEIISADSRQVYRGLDIGTEKITAEEMGGIPHHLIDVADPKDIYTVSEWKSSAEHLITEISERGHVPIIVGGTFFYIKTLLGASIPEVAPNDALRAKLEALSTPELFSMLQKLDPERAKTIDADNPRRLVRALEIIDTLGSVPERTHENPYDALIIGITHEPEELKKRISKRLGETLDKGLIEETEKILAEGVSKERLEEIGLEYRVALEYLDGILTKEECEKKLIQKVWQYAKRQLTWLKKMNDVHWYTLDEKEKILKDVRGFLKN